MAESPACGSGERTRRDATMEVDWRHSLDGMVHPHRDGHRDLRAGGVCSVTPAMALIPENGGAAGIGFQGRKV